MFLRKVVDKISFVVDFLICPFVLIASLLMKFVRRLGIWRLPISRFIFERVGIYPIRDHYYEPLFNYRGNLHHSLRDKRNLPGVDMNEEQQLQWLSKFQYGEELKAMPRAAKGSSFYYDNPNFAEGDAECLYSLIRFCKPNRIIEIGSGFSTMMAREAIKKNQLDDSTYKCKHICIEPYEMQWLDKVPEIEIIRQKVELMDQKLFLELEENDILFIDSSHMIRPQSDVLCEYLEILPILKPGVLVHVHDIFTPRDYLNQWLLNELKLWNEQYLLEGFLSCSQRYEVVLALNYLWHDHKDNMLHAFPMLTNKESEVIEPRSFWIRSLG